jgi:hypothetical protein
MNLGRFLPNNKYLKWLVLSLILLTLILIGYQLIFRSYSTTESGLNYRFIKGGALKEQLGPNNYCLVEYMIIGPENDTIQNTFHSDTMMEIPYPTDARNEMMEALQLSKPGSIMEVLISTDSLKQKISNHYKIKLLPSGQKAKFIIHVDKILNAQDYEVYTSEKIINRAMAENKLIDEFCAKKNKDGAWLLDSFQSIKYRVKNEETGAFSNQINLLSIPPIHFKVTLVEYDVYVTTLKGDLIFDSRLEGRKYKAEQLAFLNGLRILDELPFFVNEGEIGEFVTTSGHGFGAFGRIGVPSYAPLYVKIYNVKVLK